MQLAMNRGHPSSRDAQQGGSGGAWSPGPGQNHYSTQYKLGKAKGLKQLSGVRLEVMAVGGQQPKAWPQNHLGGGLVGDWRGLG